MGRERNNHGRYSDRIPPDVVLDVFDERDDLARPLTASDIVDELEIARRTAHNKLNELVERGALETRKIGARGRVWWVPMPADRAEPAPTSAPQERVTPSADEPDRVDTTDDEPREPAEEPVDEPPTVDTGDDLAEAVRSYLEENDLPPKTAHGRAAVVDVFRALREHGTLATSELQEQVYEGYTDKWAGARGMWNAIDRYLEDVPGIEKGGYGEWTYAGDDAVRETLADTLPATGGIYDPSKESEP